jgi:hypothetical protein
MESKESDQVSFQQVQLEHQVHNASIQESTEQQKKKAQRIYQRSLRRKGGRKKNPCS